MIHLIHGGSPGDAMDSFEVIERRIEEERLACPGYPSGRSGWEIHWVVPPSQDASGKWRFRLGSHTKNGIINPGGDCYWAGGQPKRYTGVKVDGDRHSQVRWRFGRGNDKPIHGSCTIYFPGGILRGAKVIWNCPRHNMEHPSIVTIADQPIIPIPEITRSKSFGEAARGGKSIVATCMSRTIECTNSIYNIQITRNTWAFGVHCYDIRWHMT